MKERRFRQNVLTLVSVLVVLGLIQVKVARAQEWKPVGDRIKTPWADSVTVENVWQEYPRPQLVRENWVNLNGLWDYAITPGNVRKPKGYDGKILVPFAVESALSGVGKSLQPDEILWYRTQLEVPASWEGQQIVLHFGAVDYRMELTVNGKKVGSHVGGSDPFSFDITKAIKGAKNEIVVKVTDPTDTETQPRGKQTLNPKGIFYTPVSGIWQTVWAEPVQAAHIKSFHAITDVDGGAQLITEVPGLKGGETIELELKYQGKSVFKSTEKFASNLKVKINKPNLWSPSFPHLYDLSLKLIQNGKVVDVVESYMAFREVSLEQDANGFWKIFLNGSELFNWGTLDQGWWPDGLLTPPTDAAQQYDIDVLKDMGFNMIRKHIKVENDRYYYYADKVGMLIWQDMPSGFLKMHSEQHVQHDWENDWARPAESAQQFEKEWKWIMDSKRFFPSIVVWVPFNEGWGQYETKRVVEWTMAYDTTRIIDGVSGWTDRKVGHMHDTHQYPGPGIEPAEQNPGRAIVLGEFGGLGYPITENIWDPGMRNWGYRTYYSQPELIDEYAKLMYNLYPERSRGLAGAIYTQTTDVEGEVNGLLTYDRKIQKIPTGFARMVHAPLYDNDVKKAEFLVYDSEVSPHQLLVGAMHWKGPGSVQKTDLKSVDAPVDVAKDGSLIAMQEFECKAGDIPENITLKIYVQGDVKVYLNGQLVGEKFMRTKRHYDDWNISDYSQFLRAGTNTIWVVVENAEQDFGLDFGLYEF